MQMQLFRNGDPSTSRDAAAKVERFRCSHEAAIYAAICANDGIHYRQIAALAKLEPIQVARRLKGMEERRLIRRDRDEVTGRYRVRDNMALWFKA